MPKRGIDFCLDVIQWFITKNIITGFKRSVLERAIKEKVGSRNSTVQAYITLLQEFGLIVPDGDDRFHIDENRAIELGR